jgi:hypothetical protein
MIPATAKAADAITKAADATIKAAEIALLVAAHKHSTRHRVEVESSPSCACFFCFRKFPSSTIKAWVDTNQTALCPSCGVDSVIGSAASVRLDDAFLRKLHQHFFGYRTR